MTGLDSGSALGFEALGRRGGSRWVASIRVGARRAVRRALLALLLSVVWTAVGGAAVQERAVVDVLTELPLMENVRVSPDGNRLLALVGLSQSGRRLVIVSLDGSETDTIDASGQNRLLNAEWLGSNHLLLKYQDQVRDRDRGIVRLVARSYIYSLVSMQAQELDQLAVLAGTLPADPESVLFWMPVTRAGQTVGRTNSSLDDDVALFIRNLETGQMRREFTGSLSATYLIDSNGVPLVQMVNSSGRESGGFNRAIRDWDNNRSFYVRVRREGNWRDVDLLDSEALSEGAHDGLGRAADMAGILPDGRTVAFSSVYNGRLAVFGLNLDDGAVFGPVVQSSEVDVGGNQGAYLRDRHTNRLVGVRRLGTRGDVDYLDPEVRRIHSLVSDSLRGRSVEVESWDVDRTVWTVRAVNHDGHASYYVLDTRDAQLRLIGRERSSAFDDIISTPERILIPSDSDSPAHAIVLRGDPSADNFGASVILMPETMSAPISDRMDIRRQYLAALGFTVIELEARGGTGRGLDAWRVNQADAGTRFFDDVSGAMAWISDDESLDSARTCLLGFRKGSSFAIGSLSEGAGGARCAIVVPDLAGDSNFGVRLDRSSTYTAHHYYVGNVAVTGSLIFYPYLQYPEPGANHYSTALTKLSAIARSILEAVRLPEHDTAVTVLNCDAFPGQSFDIASDVLEALEAVQWPVAAEPIECQHRVFWLLPGEEQAVVLDHLSNFIAENTAAPYGMDASSDGR
ncbi:hypothetical protein [uncultured Maricaulis sp.]|uniref:hypothetical protein n=1 Tax=uncultured Maricaulis sp. TaxID=174710 RepID=UPI002610B744|nr:hypothetical protein [uncultured Maricaulis sp.]